jgi:hypothetical protein
LATGDDAVLVHPALVEAAGYFLPDRFRGAALRIFVDDTVPPGKREIVRETTAARLLPSLRAHPQFSNLAVLVSSDPRRGGWQVSVVALDPNLSPTGAEMSVDAVVLEGLQQALARL